MSSRPTEFWHELDGKMGHVGQRDKDGDCDTFTCSPELFSQALPQPELMESRTLDDITHTHMHKHTNVHTLGNRSV